MVVLMGSLQIGDTYDDAVATRVFTNRRWFEEKINGKGYNVTRATLHATIRSHSSLLVESTTTLLEQNDVS